MTITPRSLEVGKGKVVMVYGVPGAGKTRFVGTGPKTLILRPPDDHTDSIAPGSDCEEHIMEDWADMFETFAWLQQEGHKHYQWVWLDSISLMQDRLLESVLEDMMMRRPDLAMDKGGENERWAELAKQNIRLPEFGADKGDYKINFDRIAKWVRDMSGIAKAGAFNFGMTAHPFEWENPITLQNEWAPWIQGKGMSQKICGYMNIVAYLEERKGGNKNQRVLMVDEQGFVGKDQLFCFPELKSKKHGIIEPTMPKLIKAIKGSAVQSDDEPTRSTAKRRPAKRRRVASKK